MKKYLVIFFVALLAVSLVALPACSKKTTDKPIVEKHDTETPTADSCFIFTALADDTYQVAPIDSQLPARLVIPSTHSVEETQDGQTVEVLKAVTTIKDHAFKNVKSLEVVIIPENVTTISVSAFYGCENITEASIPHSITKISYISFYGCNKLTDVYYNGTVKEWKALSTDGAFSSNPIVHCTDGDTK